MIRRIVFTALAGTLAWVAPNAVAPLMAAGAPGHSHEIFSAGEPGNPKKPSRVIRIRMIEKDGQMLYEPSRIEVKRGEQIKFVLRNEGEIDHEFVLATKPENDKHAEEMMKNPEMEHDDPNAKRVVPRKARELLWRFTKPGEFEFACLIPGHREAGMLGTIVVKK